MPIYEWNCVACDFSFEALASVVTEVNKLRERVQQLEGSGVNGEPLSESLQRIMEDMDYQI